MAFDARAARPGTAMRPDPITGARWRALAIVLYLLCGVVTCTRATETTVVTRAKRIVTVGGPVTETVFALGHGNHVVGVDTSSVYPAEVTKLPQVGYQRTLASESILALSPDLVIVAADAGPPAALDQLRAAGVRVEIMPAASTIDEAAARIEAIGVSLREDAAAKVLASRLRADTKTARERCCAGDYERPRAVLVYARGAGTIMLAGSDTPAAAMLELAGARNAVVGFSGFKPISSEALVDAAPDVIVIPARGLTSLGGVTGLLAVPGMTETPAGRMQRIVAIDDLLLLGFGPRLALAIDELSRGMTRGSGS